MATCKIFHLAIILKLEKDLTAIFSDQIINFDLSKLDKLSFSDLPQYLISSIDYCIVTFGIR